MPCNMWDILKPKNKNVFKKLNSNLNGPLDFSFFLKSLTLAGQTGPAGAGGSQVLFTGDIMFTVLLFPAS